MKSIEFVMPVYNEEKDLEKSITVLYKYLSSNIKNNWKITIADNASTDRTAEVGKRLSRKFNKADYFYVNRKGRGIALRKTWMKSEFDYVAYMDIDLSTDLKHISKLIEKLDDGYDIVSGNRLMKQSKTKRSFLREILSQGYNTLLRLFLWTKITDAQCGFKAARTETVKKLIPLVKDNSWFFDTELLLIAEKKKYRIKQIPIEWTEDPDTRVKVVRTVLSYLKDIIRMRFKLWFCKF
jgi:glycosyltransferase involved in cell wall biosynthesis